jgi:ABC-2 type transport system ATP-binding protein
MAEPIISVKNVKKDFYLPHEKGSNSIKGAVVNIFKKRDKQTDTHHALKKISFDIQKGEFFGIVGRNGSGKSTLLKMLAGIYQPTSGTVKTHGKVVPFIELGVGFNPELTGRENVYLNGALLGFSTKEIDEIYDEIVGFAELQDFMEQKLKNYSSGMQVRLAFSVATRAKADILIVDEVLAVGDAAFQRKCYEYFKALKKTDTTIVFVTHDMSAVRGYCDRTILIEEGVITNSGSPEDVADEYMKLFIQKTKLVLNEPGRWGNGEVVFENIKHEVTPKSIVINFDLVNKAGKGFDHELNIAIDFYVYGSGKLVTGIDSRYSEEHKVGVSVGSGETKHIKIDMANTLSGLDYMTEFILTTDSGEVCDKVKNVFALQGPNKKNGRKYHILPSFSMQIHDK